MPYAHHSETDVFADRVGHALSVCEAKDQRALHARRVVEALEISSSRYVWTQAHLDQTTGEIVLRFAPLPSQLRALAAIKETE